MAENGNAWTTCAYLSPTPGFFTPCYYCQCLCPDRQRCSETNDGLFERRVVSVYNTYLHILCMKGCGYHSHASRSVRGCGYHSHVSPDASGGCVYHSHTSRLCLWCVVPNQRGYCQSGEGHWGTRSGGLGGGPYRTITVPIRVLHPVGLKMCPESSSPLQDSSQSMAPWAQFYSNLKERFSFLKKLAGPGSGMTR